jgi:hypothetical protein
MNCRTTTAHHRLSELQPMDAFDLDFYLKNKARIRARSIKQAIVELSILRLPSGRTDRLR